MNIWIFNHYAMKRVKIWNVADYECHYSALGGKKFV